MTAATSVYTTPKSSTTMDTEYSDVEDRDVSDSSTFSSQLAAGKPVERTNKTQLWEPYVLQRRNLSIFLISISIVALVLAAVFAVSQRNQGLCGFNDRYYYAWTYGPTAIFALLSAYWYLVEFRAKQIMPWLLMSQGPTAAVDSVLLDYISPWNVVALWQSLRRRHFLVALAIAGSLILQLATVLSTGLLTGQHLQVSSHIPVTITQEFDSDPGHHKLAGWRDDMLPYALGYGEEFLNVSCPFGSTRNYAFPDFTSAIHHTGNAVITADVDILTFETKCEEVEAVKWPCPKAGIWDSCWKLATPTCDVMFQYEGPAVQGKVSSGLTRCGTLYDTFNDDPFDPSEHGNDAAEFAFFYAYSTLSKTPTRRSIHLGLPKTNHDLQTSGLVCTARYNISHGAVSYSGSARRVDLRMDIQMSASTTHTISNVSASRLMIAPWLALDTAVWFGVGYTNFNPLNIPETAYRSGDFRAISTYFERLGSAAGVQVAKRGLLKPANISSHGLIHEQRAILVVHPLSFALIEATCVLLGIITIVLITVFTPCVVCCIDPSSLGSIAAILSESPALENALRRSGRDGLPALGKILDKCSFQTLQSQSHGNMSIRITRQSVQRDENEQGARDGWLGHDSSQQGSCNSEAKSKPWQPFAVSWKARCITIGGPLSICAVLQVLYWHSRSHDGLAKVDVEDRYIQYSWTYLPALIMVAVQALFASLFFTAKTLYPFGALRRGGASAKESVLDTSSGMPALQCLFHAVWNWRLGLAAISLAVTLSAFLTISVSGLYKPALASGSFAHVSVPQLDTWKYYLFAFQDVSLRDWDRMMPSSLVMYGNISFPAGTYNSFAFPSLGRPKVQNGSGPETFVDGSRLHVTLPAQRAVMNCTPIPSQSISIDHAGYLTSDFFHPKGCNAKSISMNFPIHSGTGYVDASATTWQDSSGLFAPEGCPSSWLVLGYLQSGRAVEGTTAVSCTPYFEMIDLNMTFLLPDLSVDPDNPPIPLNETSKILLNPVTGMPQNQYWDLDSILVNLKTDDDSTEALTPIMKAAIYGLDGVPPSELFGPDNVHKLVDRLEHVFGRATAQLISSETRTTQPSKDTVMETLPNFNATVIEVDYFRLAQNLVSTRLLQGLLGTMALCAAITYFALDTRGLLPKPPFSIAAVSSLLADSELLSIIPPGSRLGSDKDLSNIFNGWNFSMGWWERNGKYRFGIDIGEHPGRTLEDLTRLQTRFVINQSLTSIQQAELCDADVT